MAAPHTAATRIFSGSVLPPSYELAYDPAWRAIAETAAPFVIPWQIDAQPPALLARQIQARDSYIIAHMTGQSGAAVAPAAAVTRLAKKHLQRRRAQHPRRLGVWSACCWDQAE